MKQEKKYDFLIIGAGIVGLAIAREILLRKLGSVALIEKESNLGVHSSGRNSGVIHAGIYYSSNSYKAQVCSKGARAMRELAAKHNVPFIKNGKVIVATEPHLVPVLDELEKRATDNDVPIKRISLKELKNIEPYAKSCDSALYSPETGVIDSKAMLQLISSQAAELGAKIYLNTAYTKGNDHTNTIETTGGNFDFGYLINTAGLQADRLAHDFKVGLNYDILPFKGIYWLMGNKSAEKVNGSIYPAPDPELPFLGVHITKGVNGKVLIGPTAIPAFGRENYRIFDNIESRDVWGIASRLSGLYLSNKNGFRNMVHAEVMKYLPSKFLACSRMLMPTLDKSDVVGLYKVGMRSQLFDKRTNYLEMDFVLEKGTHSMHVLNAVSPAFTSSLELAKKICDKI